MRHYSLLLLALLAAVGCNSEYTKRLNETNLLLFKSEPFRRDLLAETKRASLPEVGLAIRMPKLHDANHQPISANGNEVALTKVVATGAERLSRLRPLAINAAQNFSVGTADACDALFTNKDKQSVYGGMYTVSIDSKTAKPETIPGLVTVLLKAGGITAAWVDRAVDSPAGTTIPYKYLTYTGKMRFLSDVNRTDAAAFVDAVGRIDLYLTSDDTRTLLVGWVLPADASVSTGSNPPTWTPVDANSFFNSAALAMGTAQIAPPAAPAAPAAPGNPAVPAVGAPMNPAGGPMNPAGAPINPAGGPANPNPAGPAGGNPFPGGNPAPVNPPANPGANPFPGGNPAPVNPPAANPGANPPAANPFPGGNPAPVNPPANPPAANPFPGRVPAPVNPPAANPAAAGGPMNAGDDNAFLQGKWKATMMDNKPVSEDIVVDGNAMTMGPGFRFLFGAFSLDPTKSPKQIDFTPSGPNKQPLLGIYEISGNQFKMALTPGRRATDYKQPAAVTVLVKQ